MIIVFPVHVDEDHRVVDDVRTDVRLMVDMVVVIMGT